MAPPAPMNLLTTAQAAERLGVSQRRVVALIRAGRLPTVRAGLIHLIDPADLQLVKERKPGRPWPALRKQPAAKRKSDEDTPGGAARQDASRRTTLRKAGVPVDAPRRKRKR
jgi:excisionase family DNA binding protein